MPAVLLIQPWDVEAMWETVAPHLSKALARQGEFGAEDVKALCRSNAMQLWYVPESHALVTQIQDKPLCRVCMIVLCGGTGLAASEAVMSEIERYARAMRCDELRIEGRRGWARVLGYEAIATVMRKKL